MEHSQRNVVKFLATNESRMSAIGDALCSETVSLMVIMCKDKLELPEDR